MANRIVGWVILVPLCLGLIAFALANRHVVAINFNPFVSGDGAVPPGYGVPLFVVLYVVLLVPDWSAAKLNVTRFAVTLVLAQLSSSLVEQPALRLKKRLERR